jgi:molecular chaperone Hsp33
MADMDEVLGFTIAARHARGRVVRLGPVLEEILAAHGYPPVIERLLAEALVLTALLGSTLKNDTGQMTLQAQTEEGAIELLVCDYRGGAVRGYVKHNPEKLGKLDINPSLTQIFGKGYLAITFDQESSEERYQGIVPLEGDTLAHAVEAYFGQSEQIPSMIRFGMAGDVAAGMLLQHLPEGEVGRERLHVRHDHPDWDHVAAHGMTLGAAELCDPEVPLADLIWRLFHEEREIRVLEPARIAKGCRCNAEHVRNVIMRFPDEERQEMANEDGVVTVDCAFCSRNFHINC